MIKINQMEEKKKKKSKKIRKSKDHESNYQNMLKKMDIIVEEKDFGSNFNGQESENKSTSFDQTLRVEDLLSNLENKNIKTSKVKQQYSDLNKKGVFTSYYIEKLCLIFNRKKFKKQVLFVFKKKQKEKLITKRL